MPISIRAKKLTVINRIFYVWPKNLLLWLYFKGLRRHKHLQWLIFENLIPDVAYVLKSHSKDRMIESLNEWVGDTKYACYFQKDFL